MKLGNDVFLFYEVAKFILKFAEENHSVLIGKIFKQKQMHLKF